MSSFATVAQLRAEMNLSSTSDDATLQRLLDAATRTINRFCNRPRGFDAAALASVRYYSGSGGPCQSIDECVEVTEVAVKSSPSDDEDSYTSWTVGTVGTTTDADVFPASGDPEVPDYSDTPYDLLIVGTNGSYSSFTSGSFTSRRGFRPSTTIRRGVPTVKVTARWGYADSTPADILEACIMQSARWYKRLQSAMADSLASADFGQLMFRKSLDPDVELILRSGRYVRPPIG